MFVLGTENFFKLSFSSELIKLLAVANALRAGGNATPPQNMKRALIFMASIIMASGSMIFLLRGAQARKELDEKKQEQAIHRIRASEGEPP